MKCHCSSTGKILNTENPKETYVHISWYKYLTHIFSEGLWSGYFYCKCHKRKVTIFS